MSRVVTPIGVFDLVTPESEKTFEEAIVAHKGLIFGDGRHYLNCKRRIGAKGKRVNIPDAYLLDLRRAEHRT